jgi:hypothetical protein
MFSLSRPIRVIASAPPGSVSRHDGHTAVVPPHPEEVHRMHVDAAGWRSRNSRESLIARLNLLVGQLKEASGIAEKAGLVLLTLADQNSVAFEVSQSTRRRLAHGNNESARQANRRVEVLIKGVDLTVSTPPDTQP